jgi:hypothetical protein
MRDKTKWLNVRISNIFLLFPADWWKQNKLGKQGPKKLGRCTEFKMWVKMFVYNHQKHAVALDKCGSVCGPIPMFCGQAKRNCEFRERLRIYLGTERLSSFLRSTPDTFLGLEVWCLYSKSKESRKSFVGAPFAHVDHVNLLLWHTLSFHISELWKLQIKYESMPSTDDIFGISILLLFVEFFDMIMRFYLCKWWI